MIQVIDEIVARPGDAKSLLDHYLTRYAPGALVRGMVLEQILVSPPIWLKDQSNTLTMRWSLVDAAAWWQMRAMGSGDLEVAKWWAEIDARVISRRRSFAAGPADVEALCDV